MEFDIIESSKLADILKTIDNYNSGLLISHVIIFFKRHDIEFTKTMIQNYVRMGLIPSPSGNRRYTREHIILLALINGLKDIYSLDEIKTLFDAMEGILEPEELYRLFMRLHTDAINDFKKMRSICQSQILIEESKLKDMDDNKATSLILLLTLPTYSKIIKNIISALWNTI